MTDKALSAPAVTATPYLAWDTSNTDERRFRILVALFAIFALAIALVVESVIVPEPDRREAAKVPERIARLVMERKKAEPPPEKKPEPEKEIVEEKPTPRPQPEEKAKEKAQKALSQVEKELDALRDLAKAFEPQKDLALTNDGSQKNELSRDLLTSRSGKEAEKLAIGSVSRGGGGEGLEGGGKLAGALAKVSSNIAEGPTGPVTRDSGKLVRTQEEVRRVMDRNNGALQAIYQRALRNNPILQGTVVLKLVIAPDGKVTRCELVSSQLNDPEAEQKLVSRIRAIDFGAIAGVAVWDDTYTLNFFPG